MGVNKHNNLIMPHNGEDEHVSITQRGVVKEETADKHVAAAPQKEAFSAFFSPKMGHLY